MQHTNNNNNNNPIHSLSIEHAISIPVHHRPPLSHFAPRRTVHAGHAISRVVFRYVLTLPFLRFVDYIRGIHRRHARLSACIIAHVQHDVVARCWCTTRARAFGAHLLLLLVRPKVPDLHYGPVAAAGHDDGGFVLERDAPYRFGGLAEFADQVARAEIPHLDAAVRAAGYDARIVELEARDAVVVRCEAVDGREGVERPHAHGAVGTTGYERGGGHLELADEGSVPLEDGEALTVVVLASFIGCILAGSRILTHRADSRSLHWYLSFLSRSCHRQRRWRRSG